MSKRRTVEDEDFLPAAKEWSTRAHLILPRRERLSELVATMNGGDRKRQLVGMRSVRQMLCMFRSGIITTIIDSGIVPIAIRFLQDFEYPQLQFESTWALANIAWGTTAHTNAVIENNAVPHLVALLYSKYPQLVERALLALGNIVGDNATARNIVLEHDVVSGLLGLFGDTSLSLSVWRIVAWLCRNLCRYKNPSPPWPQIRRLLPLLSELLQHGDMQVVSYTCWALTFATDDGLYKLQPVVETGALLRLVTLLDVDELTILMPALSCVGNIAMGNEQQTEAIIDAGGLQKLKTLLYHSTPRVVHFSAWIIGTMTTSTMVHIQSVMDSGIFVRIRHLLIHGDVESQESAAWVVSNAIVNGSPWQIFELFAKFDLLPPFRNLLDSDAPRIVKIVLTGLTRLYDLNETLGCDVKNICSVDKVKCLQMHADSRVRQLSANLISCYITKPTEKNHTPMEEVIPSPDENEDPILDNVSDVSIKEAEVGGLLNMLHLDSDDDLSL